ncbi:MAG TPA: prepilin-type cleavage/methylation domain-containing protein, partial [Firmicutes bacterium]|nr:prepilin-type cleavage/methylation domain-containing protein [Bacillota bacterium]
NPKGFTLVETLIGLFITGMIVLMCTVPLMQFLDYVQFSQVLSTFRQDVNVVRQHNLTPGNSFLQLRIYPASQKYEVQYVSTLDVYIRRELPKNINLSCSGTLCTISFNSVGNISQARTLQATSSYFKKQLVFSVGGGGLDIR